MKRLLWVPVVAGLVLACGGGGGGTKPPPEQKTTKITARLFDNASHTAHLAGAGDRAARVAVEPVLHALDIGANRFIAYAYRPGAAVQFRALNDKGYRDAGDWSTWAIADSTAQADNKGWHYLLEQGGQIDLSAARQDAPDASFVSSVGTFEIDLLEYFTGEGGVVMDMNGGTGTPNLVYWGVFGCPLHGFNPPVTDCSTWEHPLKDQPAPYNTLETHMVETIYAGDPQTESPWVPNVALVFARTDWFPSPVHVILKNLSTSYGPQYERDIYWSSTALSVDQRKIILSFANGNGRSSDHLVFLPAFATPLKVDLTGADASAITGAVSLNLGVELSDAIIDYAHSSMVDGFPPEPTVAFAGDANGVPFGVSLSLTVNGTEMPLYPPR